MAHGVSADRRKLPIGIQTFREIREAHAYYVDKTDHIRRLATGGKHYFLSRPRRFGKSLLLDTIKELFEGDQALFKGLAVHDKWHWQPRPVVRLDFAAGDFGDPTLLAEDVAAQLADAEAEAGIPANPASASIRLRRLLQALHEKSGQRVVLLVDEYDRPILDALEEPTVARANRRFLRGLYAVIKSADAHLEFTLLTGVSKFSKVSLFSGLNNLLDITLDPRYAAICGYTDDDLSTVFGPELPGLDRSEIRRWYNGYNWLGQEAETVYNPFDILLLFDSRRFKAHWFETGSPKFLIDTLRRHHIPSLDLARMTTSEALLSAFDIDEMAAEALLFQTGYLTIVGEDNRHGRTRYRLGYPNLEVRQGLNERLLMAWLPDAAWRRADEAPLRDLLGAEDFAGIEAFFRALFASVPYQWHVNNDIHHFEGYYASIVYSCFAAHGFDLVPEDSASTGRADLAVRCNDAIYLFEFKLSPDAPGAGGGTALAQIKNKRYADKYRHLGKPIHLIGMEFSKAQRNLGAFEVERAA